MVFCGVSLDDPPQPPTVPEVPFARALADLERRMERRIEIIEKTSLAPPPPASSPGAPQSLTPVPGARPSMAARAAKGTALIGVGGLALLGLVTAVAQFAATRYPAQMGPVVAALEALLTLAKGSP